MRGRDVDKGVVPGERRRLEEHLKVHHVVDDDLTCMLNDVDIIAVDDPLGNR